MANDVLNLVTVAGIVRATGSDYSDVTRAIRRAGILPAQTCDGRPLFREDAIAAVRAELRTVERAVAIDPNPRNRTPGHPGMEIR